MTTDDKIEDEKLQYDINREERKISALSPEKSDKHEYLTGKGILPSYQGRVIDQSRFTYSPLCKTNLLLKDFIPRKKLNPEMVNELKRIENIEEKLIGIKCSITDTESI